MFAIVHHADDAAFIQSEVSVAAALHKPCANVLSGACQRRWSSATNISSVMQNAIRIHCCCG